MMRLAVLVAFGMAAIGASVAMAQQAKVLPNAFFAMDTGLRDGKHGSPEARAAVLAELGYAGSDHSGTGNLPATLKAYEAKGIKLFGIYVGLDIDSDKVDPGLARAIGQLKGTGAFLWAAVRSKKFKASDLAGDDAAAALLTKLADLAEPAGVKIALYPHTGFWIERPEDAARVAKKVGRKCVGATFNLCHWLKVDGKDLEATLRGIAPQLSVVSINGADYAGKNWNTLIQTLDRGSFDVVRVLRELADLKYAGPVGLQAYGIKGSSKDNLARSMAAWKRLSALAAAARERLLAGGDLAAFRGDTGAWTLAAEVAQDAKNAKMLAWKPGTGALVNGPKGRTRNLFTKFEHGDCDAHVEFMVPKGSNSGVYFQGRYEIQILDSWGVKKPAHGDCGGIYQRWGKGKGYEGRPPRVNAAREPGRWQTFDVTFRAPRFGADGKKTADACFVKVVHNGVVVHENEPVTGPTRAAAFRDEKPAGPIMLQGDHGPVAYRNLWLVPRKLEAKAR